MSRAGSLDAAFGVGGVATLPAVPSANYQAVASAAQPDGKVVVVGRLSSSTLNILGYNQAVVARYNADGSLDASFGAGGYYTSSQFGTLSTLLTPFDASARAVAIQPDGKIVVAAEVANGAKVFRLTAGGALDTSFAAGGVASLGSLNVLGSQLNYATSVAVLPGGRIAVGGADDPILGHDVAAVEMLTATGAVDTTFGAGGVAVIPQSSIGLLAFLPIVPILSSGNFIAGSPVEVAAQADGKVVVIANASPTGTSASSALVSNRFTASGALDTTYGVGGAKLIGTSTLGIAGGGIAADSVALQADGKLVIGASVAGSSSVANQLAVLRLTTGGTLDPSFGLGGLTLPSPQSLGAGAITVQADGKVVLADLSSPTFARLQPNGLPDPTFGVNGTSVVAASTGGYVGVAVVAGGKIEATRGGSSPALVRLLGHAGVTGDYDGDGISDPAIYLTTQGAFAYRATGGGPGRVIPFGPAGAGQSLPAPGDYDGDGVADIALYLPSQGAFAVRSVSGQGGTLTRFGTSGVGNSIPAPGDYDGSGKTEYAVYLPEQGLFAYRPASGRADVLVPFGMPGAGNSIPVPADYFGTGHDAIAVYLPASGSYAIRNPATGRDSIIAFGAAGAGQSIPVPGDYDGSGHAELAVYIPALGELIYRPANGGPDVAVPFGARGAGLTLPAPGDYDGSGKTDVAAYLPTLGQFAYRPGNGGGDVLLPFGTPNQTIPFVAASATDTIPTVSGASVHAMSATVPVEIPLTPDVLDWIDGTAAKKHGNHA